MNNIAIKVLLFLILPHVSSEPPPECNFSKTFVTEYLTAKYSSNWKAYHYSGGHSLMYYEEANFDRREDSEIIFSRAAIPNYLKLDTNKITAQFIEYQVRVFKNAPKFPKDAEIRKGDESFEMINGVAWRKVTLFVSGTENNVRREFESSYFIHCTPEFIYAVTLGYKMPKIPTVEREFPCILESIVLKN